MPSRFFTYKEIFDNFDSLQNQYWFYYIGPAIKGAANSRFSQEVLFLGGLKEIYENTIHFSEGKDSNKGETFRIYPIGRYGVEYEDANGIWQKSNIAVPGELAIQPILGDLEERMLFKINNNFLAVPMGGDPSMRVPSIYGGGKRKKRCTMRKKCHRKKRTLRLKSFSMI